MADPKSKGSADPSNDAPNPTNTSNESNNDQSTTPSTTTTRKRAAGPVPQKRRSAHERQQLVAEERRRNEERARSQQDASESSRGRGRGRGDRGRGTDTRGSGHGARGGHTGAGAAGHGETKSFDFMRYQRGGASGAGSKQPTAAQKRRLNETNGIESVIGGEELQAYDPGLFERAKASGSGGAGKREQSTTEKANPTLGDKSLTPAIDNRSRVKKDADAATQSSAARERRDVQYESLSDESDEEFTLSRGLDLESLNIETGFRHPGEHIDLDDEDREETTTGRGTSRATGKGYIRPIFAQRTPHFDRTLNVNTEASTVMATGGSADSRVKSEPGAGLDGSKAGVSQRSGPRSGRSNTRKVPVKNEDGSITEITEHAQQEDDEELQDEDDEARPLSPAELQAQRKLKGKGRLLNDETTTTAAGDDRTDGLTFDANSMAAMPPPIVSDEVPSASTKPDRKRTLLDVFADSHSTRNSLFFFQFPSPRFLPPLKVKDKNDGEATLQATEKPKAQQEKSLLKADPDVKKEEDDEQLPLGPGTDPWTERRKKIYQTIPKKGQLGKLQLHKSGRVTLDWGGIKFKIMLGAEHRASHTACIVKMPETLKSQEAKPKGGADYGGDVVHTLIASPTWKSLLLI